VREAAEPADRSRLSLALIERDECDRRQNEEHQHVAATTAVSGYGHFSAVDAY
jgi:hypothetical protein